MKNQQARHGALLVALLVVLRHVHVALRVARVVRHPHRHRGAGDGQLAGKHSEVRIKTPESNSHVEVEEAVAGLKEEQAGLGVIVIGGDAKGSETFTLSQQLLLSRALQERLLLAAQTTVQPPPLAGTVQLHQLLTAQGKRDSVVNQNMPPSDRRPFPFFLLISPLLWVHLLFFLVTLVTLILEIRDIVTGDTCPALILFNLGRFRTVLGVVDLPTQAKVLATLVGSLAVAHLKRHENRCVAIKTFSQPPMRECVYCDRPARSKETPFHKQLKAVAVKAKGAAAAFNTRASPGFSVRTAETLDTTGPKNTKSPTACNAEIET
ncbi:hypothetical protein EYF80_012720 [Liparis tanakae]|uniref:Secreted protein n=1 Tax=Liparis tanakae TaxID=230148 RepID=A0A4Z2IIE6_9TELE|nr:hypothetical protein EYF80_012720 [Liparis tanakae]